MGFFDELVDVLTPGGDTGFGLPSEGDVLRGFTGISGAEAAAEGARLQAEVGREGLQLTREAQERLEETLAPFVGFGEELIPQAMRLFGRNAGQAIVDDPVFTALADEAQRRIFANQAARGRLGSGETPIFLQDALLRTGTDLLSRQRGDFLSGIGLGQASAAQQAAGGLQTSSRSADILSQIGNVQAAGGIGAANALGQGSSNIVGLGTALASIFASERGLKSNIKLRGVRPDGVNIYSFNYRFDPGTEYIGAMADEVPHAVVDLGGYKAVDYARI